jgi:hypothetical protein
MTYNSVLVEIIAMKKNLLVLTMLAIPCATFAKRTVLNTIQLSSQPKYALKVYNAFSYMRMEETVPANTSGFSFKRTTYTDMVKPSVAFNWRTAKGNLNEVELSSLMIGKKNEEYFFRPPSANIPVYVGGAGNTSSNITVRYEHIKDFFKRKAWKLRPMLGLGMSAFYRSDRLETTGSNAFIPLSEQRVGVKFEVAPRVNYNISKRVFIDLNIPVNVMQSDAWFSKMQNTPTSEIQKTSISNFAAAPKEFAIRLGVGVRL